MLSDNHCEPDSPLNQTRLPSLLALRCFEAAARLENFSHAGVELHLTPGAVSRAVRLLENELGVALFDRGLVPVDLSGWTRPEGLKPAYPTLDADIVVDILVVGAGLAGSSLALHLAEAGVSVAVIEARQPGWGASGRAVCSVQAWPSQ